MNGPVIQSPHQVVNYGFSDHSHLWANISGTRESFIVSHTTWFVCWDWTYCLWAAFLVIQSIRASHSEKQWWFLIIHWSQRGMSREVDQSYIHVPFSRTTLFNLVKVWLCVKVRLSKYLKHNQQNVFKVSKLDALMCKWHFNALVGGEWAVLNYFKYC